MTDRQLQDPGKHRILSQQVTRVAETGHRATWRAGLASVRLRAEFTSLFFVEWCKVHGITLIHIQPGKPVQNGHAESFNGRFRDE